MLLAGGTHCLCVERSKNEIVLINFERINIILEACVAVPKKNKIQMKEIREKEFDYKSVGKELIPDSKGKKERSLIKKIKDIQIK
ncbi:unnamed protein product [Meloidogyne enterolobii]|uniref:Uncharacterized protein n=1 Tax=Meloidogyne enterolobii TaxID=390850 RepID=A0ACB1ABT3_MELEN